MVLAAIVMTGQMNDMCRYKDEIYAISGIQGGRLFVPETYGLTPSSSCTACWRGYLVTYEILDNMLCITHLLVNNNEDVVLNGVEPKKSDGLFDWTYSNLNMQIEFTGRILLAKDFIDSMYVHMGFQRPISYRKVIELQFEKGELVKEVDLSAKMEQLRTEDSGKDAQPESYTDEDVKKWIRGVFSIEYDIVEEE